MEEKILALRSLGYSYGQIVLELNCSKSLVAYYCGQNARTLVRDRTRKRRAKIKQEYNGLKNKPCTDCGVQYPPYVMDFDHLGDKTADVSRLATNLYVEKYKKEIEKCELVCANCHRIRTYNRNNMPL